MHIHVVSARSSFCRNIAVLMLEHRKKIYLIFHRIRNSSFSQLWNLIHLVFTYINILRSYNVNVRVLFLSYSLFSLNISAVVTKNKYFIFIVIYELLHSSLQCSRFELLIKVSLMKMYTIVLVLFLLSSIFNSKKEKKNILKHTKKIREIATKNIEMKKEKMLSVGAGGVTLAV